MLAASCCAIFFPFFRVTLVPLPSSTSILSSLPYRGEKEREGERGRRDMRNTTGIDKKHTYSAIEKQKGEKGKPRYHTKSSGDWGVCKTFRCCLPILHFEALAPASSHEIKRVISWVFCDDDGGGEKTKQNAHNCEKKRVVCCCFVSAVVIIVGGG